MRLRSYFIILFLFFLTALLGCFALGGEAPAQILDVGQELPAPPKTITVQAAAPNVTVQAAPAPNVTVQAAQAPNVTVEAAKAPNVTVQAPPPANVNVAAPNIHLPEQKTDWQALFAQLGAALAAIAAGVGMLVRTINKLRNSHIDEAAWQDLLSYCYQSSGGNVANAMMQVPIEYQALFGEPISTKDSVAAKHGLAALHLDNVGIDQDAEVVEAKKTLAALIAKKSAVVATTFLMMLLLFSGCNENKAAQKLNESLIASNTAAQSSFKNITDTLVTFYVNEQNALEDARYQAAISSITKTVSLASGGTLQTANPNEVAALGRQHERNQRQIQSVADNMRSKIAASGADAKHVEQLSGALKDYFATQSNVSVNISQSAADVMALVQQFIPAKPAATALSASTKQATTAGK